MINHCCQLLDECVVSLSFITETEHLALSFTWRISTFFVIEIMNFYISGFMPLNVPDRFMTKLVFEEKFRR